MVEISTGGATSSRVGSPITSPSNFSMSNFNQEGVLWFFKKDFKFEKATFFVLEVFIETLSPFLSLKDGILVGFPLTKK